MKPYKVGIFRQLILSFYTQFQDLFGSNPSTYLILLQSYEYLRVYGFLLSIYACLSLIFTFAVFGLHEAYHATYSVTGFNILSNKTLFQMGP